MRARVGSCVRTAARVACCYCVQLVNRKRHRTKDARRKTQDAGLTTQDAGLTTQVVLRRFAGRRRLRMIEGNAVRMTQVVPKGSRCAPMEGVGITRDREGVAAEKGAT